MNKKLNVNIHDDENFHESELKMWTFYLRKLTLNIINYHDNEWSFSKTKFSMKCENVNVNNEWIKWKKIKK